MLKSEHLLTLREVVQRGSFAAAANRLGYTASAVSQQMAALEREVGVQLFHRSARRVLPTSAAEVMARHAVTVLTELERLVSAVKQEHRSTERQIRLGVFPSFGVHVLADVLKELETGIRLWVAEPSQLIPALGSGGELDAAIVYQVGNSGLSWPPGLRRYWIAEDPFRLVVPGSWPTLAPYGPEQLTDLPWIQHHPGSSDAMFFNSVFASWGLQPRAVGYSDDFSTTLAMVGAGVAVALVPALAVRHPPGDVVVADVPWLNISRSIFALTHPDRETAALRSLLDLLVSPLPQGL